MRKSIAIGTVLATLVLFGCGGDDGDTTAPAVTGGTDAESLEVVAEDIKFPEDTYEVTAGTVNVTYRNEGAIHHTLVIDGVDDFKLEVSGKGDEDAGSVELAAGSYTIYCDVAGHRQAGMEAKLEVR